MTNSYLTEVATPSVRTNFYYNKELQVLYKQITCSNDKPMLQSLHVDAVNINSLHLSKQELESLYFFLYTELIEQDIEDGKFVI